MSRRHRGLTVAGGQAAEPARICPWTGTGCTSYSGPSAPTPARPGRCGACRPGDRHDPGASGSGSRRGRASCRRSVAAQAGRARLSRPGGPQPGSPMTAFRPFFNPATGEWITYTALAEDSDGQFVRFTWRSVPGGVITEHVHPHQEERFTILAGEAHFTLNGAELVAGAGNTVVVPAGVPHSEGNPRAGQDQRRRRAPPGAAYQGVARGSRRPGGRRQDYAQGRAEEPVPARRHVVALPSRKPGHLAAYLGPEPHAPRHCGRWRRPSAYAPTTTAGTAPYPRARLRPPGICRRKRLPRHVSRC